MTTKVLDYYQDYVDADRSDAEGVRTARHAFITSVVNDNDAVDELVAFGLWEEDPELEDFTKTTASPYRKRQIRSEAKWTKKFVTEHPNALVPESGLWMDTVALVALQQYIDPTGTDSAFSLDGDGKVEWSEDNAPYTQPPTPEQIETLKANAAQHAWDALHALALSDGTLLSTVIADYEHEVRQMAANEIEFSYSELEPVLKRKINPDDAGDVPINEKIIYVFTEAKKTLSDPELMPITNGAVDVVRKHYAAEAADREVEITRRSTIEALRANYTV